MSHLRYVLLLPYPRCCQIASSSGKKYAPLVHDCQVDYSPWQAVVAASAQGEDRKDAPSDDLTPGRIFFLRNHFNRKRFPDYMNVLGMIFSMCALMMRIKW